MKVVISAGGTGGHIYPALAIIDKIKELEPKSEFLYIGTHNRMEKDIVPNHGIPFETIEIYGFYRKQIFKNFKTIKYFLKSYKKCKKLIKNFNPDVVVGVGGYVTGPVVFAGHKLGYKTFIHEQNSIPGKSNKFLSNYADKIGVSFKSSIKCFPDYKTIYTGNPCSERALHMKPGDKKDYNLTESKKLVLIVMGSLGASHVNEVLANTMELFENKSYEILFITGADDYGVIGNKRFPKNVKVVPYIENMARIMKRADLMVTRAGASTLSEIIALGIPSIIIPSPYVPDNHQYKNAQDLIEIDAASMIEEKDLTPKKVLASVDNLINNESKLKEMKSNLKSLAVKDSSTRIYEILSKLRDEA